MFSYVSIFIFITVMGNCFGHLHPDEDSDVVRKKLVLVGDGFSGKTSLQEAFRKDDFDDEYRPTVFESYATEVELRLGAKMELSIWDTAGHEDFERLRPLSYPYTHVILLCFAIDDPESFDDLVDKWKPELDFFCPKVPVILVGKETFDLTIAVWYLMAWYLLQETSWICERTSRSGPGCKSKS